MEKETEMMMKMRPSKVECLEGIPITASGLKYHSILTV